MVESTTGAGATHRVLRPTNAPALGEFTVQDGSEATVLVDQAYAPGPQPVHRTSGGAP